MEIITSYPFWFIIFCLAVGLAYAWLLYKSDGRFTETKTWLVKAMGIFRFITVSLLAFFLLSPLIKTSFREIEKPIVVIAADNSSSLKYGNATQFPLASLNEKLNQLKIDLQENYDVRFVSFGSKVTENSELTFSEKTSNYSELMEDVVAKYTGRNLGAVIVAGDGIYNSGSNPVYAAEKIRAPFYTIALGDTTIKKDIILSRINHNRIAFLGNNFPLEILVDARQCSGENTTLTVHEDSALVFSRSLSLAGNKYHITVPVTLTARKKGIHKYRIKLSNVEGELNTINNSADVYIEVLESKQKILLIANAPHPDVSAFKTAVESNLNYSMSIEYADGFKGNLSNFQLVMLHQLPSDNNITTSIIDKIKVASIPAFYVLGAQTNTRAFNTMKNGVVITSSLNRNNEILPYVNKNFSLFTVSDELTSYLNTLPPLIAPFGTYTSNAEISTLIQQRIGSLTTDQPLLYFLDQSDVKTAVLCGEGFWKWRFTEFAEKGNYNGTNELVSKIIQYLLSREKKTPFRVSNKTDYKENEPLLFDAQLVNQAGETVNEPDAQMVIYSASKKEYRYTFSKTSNAYTLNAGIFEPGSYRYVAQTKLGNINYKDQGEFTVSALQLENAETTANHQLLFAMAERTGGKMIYPLQIDSLKELIKSKEEIKPVSYYRKKLIDFISLKWVFGLIVLLLTAEWFLRKRSGAY